MKKNIIVTIFLGLFFISVMGIAEKPMVVVIPSRNNQKWCEKNVQSVIAQRYTNFRVIYINDCSSDATGEIVQRCINQSGIKERFTFINNSTRCGALANLYYAIHSCEDHEIIITLDGDDWLPHDQVLTRLNKAYQDENIWLTYGQFKTYPQNEVGFCRDFSSNVIRDNLFRECEWVTSHIRTFYAALFKQIKLKDVLYKGSIFDVTGDMAAMYPMLEMSAGHFLFIRDVLYVYNQANMLNDFRKKLPEQLISKYYVLSQEKYTRLPKLYEDKKDTVALFIFSDNNPHTLSEMLCNIQEFVSGITEYKVLYRSQGKKNEVAYKELQDTHKDIHFECVNDDFKRAVIYALAYTDSAYVLLVDESVRMHTSCDVKQCVAALQQTKAHAFFIGLGMDAPQDVPPMVPITQGIFAWQFKYAGFAFKYPYSTQMVVYQKEVLEKIVEHLVFNDVQDMAVQCNGMPFDCNEVGLCFEYSKLKRK